MNAPLPKRIWQWFTRTRVGRSIFRIGLPESNLERSQVMVSSFLLHMQPAKVNKHSLRASYSFGLGLITLYLFRNPSSKTPNIPDMFILHSRCIHSEVCLNSRRDTFICE